MTQTPLTYCKQAAAYLLNKHQLGVRLGPNLIIHCFDFIWNKTKDNDTAFWQVLVCLRQKLHHPVCSNDQSSLLELYCILKCSTMAPFTGVLSEKDKKYKRKWLTCTLNRLCSYYNQSNYLQPSSQGEISFLQMQFQLLWSDISQLFQWGFNYSCSKYEIVVLYVAIWGLSTLLKVTFGVQWRCPGPPLLPEHPSMRCPHRGSNPLLLNPDPHRQSFHRPLTEL